MRYLFVPLCFLLCTAPALADTPGLLPWTAPADQTAFYHTNLPGCYVVRTQAAYEELFAKALKGVPTTRPTYTPKVDFDRQMVVAIGRKRGSPASIYRIELDNAAEPKALLVRIALGDAFSQLPKRKDLLGTHFHLIVTPRSHLPVRFIEDTMVDARLFAIGDGVDSKEIATEPAPKAPAPPGKSALREQAEAAVCKALTAEQIAAARKELFPGAKNQRYPEPWSAIDVKREMDHWLISYDKLAFRVDVETGKVEPVKATTTPLW